VKMSIFTMVYYLVLLVPGNKTFYILQDVTTCICLHVFIYTLLVDLYTYLTYMCTLEA